MSIPRWLEWAREIQALSQTGITFAHNEYDVERNEKLAAIAAEIVDTYSQYEKENLVHDFLQQPGYATPKIDVRGAVVRDGAILLVKETMDGKWCMPGGWVDVGDAPASAVAREVWEESGFKVKPVKLEPASRPMRSSFLNLMMYPNYHQIARTKSISQKYRRMSWIRIEQQLLIDVQRL